jgi:hypothetical protein
MNIFIMLPDDPGALEKSKELSSEEGLDVFLFVFGVLEIATGIVGGLLSLFRNRTYRYIEKLFNKTGVIVSYF